MEASSRLPKLAFFSSLLDPSLARDLRAARGTLSSSLPPPPDAEALASVEERRYTSSRSSLRRRQQKRAAEALRRSRIARPLHPPSAEGADRPLFCPDSSSRSPAGLSRRHNLRKQQ